ncbi:hypothetical protein Cgig2_022059 [Carnegiea gigantea]|uniref:Uncharacterized protein n=1 Tax=Carnegiea gigantea TaxID=171969 RepID=A0A9Q1KTA1_9CARY|nr:hypothetical protein Cgig2_022059 [Carnegiea gigantea]
MATISLQISSLRCILRPQFCYSASATAPLTAATTTREWPVFGAPDSLSTLANFLVDSLEFSKKQALSTSTKLTKLRQSRGVTQGWSGGRNIGRGGRGAGRDSSRGGGRGGRTAGRDSPQHTGGQGAGGGQQATAHAAATKESFIALPDYENLTPEQWNTVAEEHGRPPITTDEDDSSRAADPVAQPADGGSRAADSVRPTGSGAAGPSAPGSTPAIGPAGGADETVSGVEPRVAASIPIEPELEQGCGRRTRTPSVRLADYVTYTVVGAPETTCKYPIATYVGGSTATQNSLRQSDEDNFAFVTPYLNAISL